ncbi:MAG TPA: Wzz/FepE/Etk N-terminal domain-containing protein [Gammaproteobacteria bacterium]
MENQQKSVQDYLAILSRRKVSIILTGLLVFIIGLVAALVWPPTYKSSATILIKEQDIPSELVRSTVTSYAAQRIQTISQRVMTRPNLMEIIEKYNLYKDDFKRKTTEQVLGQMRDAIDLNMISADVMDPRTGRPGVATIAFTLSFEGDSPGSTQKVAGELTSLFLAENIRTRKEKASETLQFLTDETTKLETRIAEAEKKLAEFKEQNSESLPEMNAMNLTILNRTESDLMNTESELRTLNERKFYLQSQLSMINPLTNMRSATGESILDPVSRLKALESELASLSARYSSEHPDIVKIKREIDGLKAQTGASGSSDETAKLLTKKRAELAALTEKYSADHPDVISLSKQVSELENKLQAKPQSAENVAMTLNPENPAYISVQTQLQTVESNIESLAARKARLKAKVQQLEKHIARSPQVEKDYQVLVREHQNALARFQDIKARQMEAAIGQELEKESKGESFVLIDPAQYPEKPVKPNRIAIIFLSFMFAMASGLGVAILKEAMDSSVRGVSGITKLLTAAPLAVIPVIYNTYDLRRKKRINMLVAGAVVGSILGVLLGIHFFWTPLDVLWFRGMRKAENVMGV